MTLTGRDVLLPTIIALFVLTPVLTLALKFVTSRYAQEDVEARFLERLKYIPSQTEILSEPTLARWLADKRNDKAISVYVVPVLFPLDILFLLCLGVFLGLASGALADRLGFLSSIPALDLVDPPRSLHGIRPCRRHGHRRHLQVIHSVDDGLVPPVEHPHGHQDRNDQRRHWSGRNPRRAERAVVLLSCRQGDLNECVSGVNERCTGPVP